MRGRIIRALRIIIKVVLTILLMLTTFGCTSNGPTGPDPLLQTSGEIIYHRHRNSLSHIVPVLVEGSGFDVAEVDSRGTSQEEKE